MTRKRSAGEYEADAPPRLFVFTFGGMPRPIAIAPLLVVFGGGNSGLSMYVSTLNPWDSRKQSAAHDAGIHCPPKLGDAIRGGETTCQFFFSAGHFHHHRLHKFFEHLAHRPSFLFGHHFHLPPNL